MWLVAFVVAMVPVWLGRVAAAQSEPQRGVVAHLVVSGDLDARELADEVVGWLAKRDQSREVLAVVQFDAARARPDLATRIGEAVRSCPVPVAVHLEARGAVEPQVVLIGLAAQTLTASRGVRIAGDASTRLEGLCPAGDTSWRGQSERFARSVLEGRDELLLDLFVRPLGSVYIHMGADGAVLSREPIETEDERIVGRTNDEEWTVRLGREEVAGLSLTTDADGLGQVLRVCNVRAFRRERTEVRSGLGAAKERVGAIREGVAARVVRLKAELREAKKLGERDRTSRARALESRLETAREEVEAAREMFERFPELYRVSPPWAFVAEPDAAGKEWVRAFEALSEDLDALKSEIDAMERL